MATKCWRSSRECTALSSTRLTFDNEVTYHTSVIGALNTVLLPNAKNAELKALLESGKPIFESHLEHAKTLQNSLNK